MNPAHAALYSSESNEHYTPPDIADAYREVSGEILLDPCSNAAANSLVRAQHYYSATEHGIDGLAEPWAGNMLINPPGGELPEKWRDFYGTRSQAVAWWLRTAHEWAEGRIASALFVGFSIEILSSTQRPARKLGLMAPTDFPICIPHKRIRFWKVEGCELVESKQPPKANALIFLPVWRPSGEAGEWQAASDVRDFRRVFQRYGAVIGCGQSTATAVAKMGRS